MGLLDPVRGERDLLRKFFIESAYLRGTEVTLILPEEVNRNIYHDPEIDTYLDGIEIDIILDRRPDRRMLEDLNWYKEDSDILPLVAYIGSIRSVNENEENEEIENEDYPEYLKVMRESIIKVETQMIEEFEEDWYLISDIVKTPYYVWMCNLTPYRYDFEEDGINEENQEGNYNILRIKEECV